MRTGKGPDFFIIHRMIIHPMYENRGPGKAAMTFEENRGHIEGGRPEISGPIFRKAMDAVAEL